MAPHNTEYERIEGEDPEEFPRGRFDDRRGGRPWGRRGQDGYGHPHEHDHPHGHDHPLARFAGEGRPGRRPRRGPDEAGWRDDPLRSRARNLIEATRAAGHRGESTRTEVGDIIDRATRSIYRLLAEEPASEREEEPGASAPTTN